MKMLYNREAARLPSEPPTPGKRGGLKGSMQHLPEADSNASVLKEMPQSPALLKDAENQGILALTYR